MAFGAAQDQIDGVRHVYPTCRETANNAVAEFEQAFAKFVAVAVASGCDVNAGCGPVNIAHQPHQNVERVCAEVAKGTDSSLCQVGHPAPFGSEPIFERTFV